MAVEEVPAVHVQTANSPTAPGKVLVLGDGTRALLAVCRSLGRRGLTVHVGWCSPRSPALASRYIARHCLLPACSVHDTGWLRALQQLLREERYALVLPCHDDDHIAALQQHRAALESMAPIYLLDDAAYSVVSSKVLTTQLARSLGIPVPRERVVHDPAEVEEIAREWGLPLILKPSSSLARQPFSGARYVQVLHTKAEAGPLAREMLAGGGLVVQQMVPGVGVGVEVLAHEGSVLYAFQHRRVHENEAGGSSYRKSEPLNPSLLEAAAKLMAALCYTGVAMVEFRQEARTGAWALLEINGRFWGSLALAVAAGADFPYYLYELLTSGTPHLPTGYREGVYCRHWSSDLRWIIRSLSRQRRPRDLLRWWGGLLWDTARLVTFREHSDTFVLDDPRPAWVDAWTWRRRKARGAVGRRPSGESALDRR